MDSDHDDSGVSCTSLAPDEDEDESFKKAAAEVVPKGAPSVRVVRRARPKWDVFDVEAFVEQLIPLVNKKKQPLSLDFRAYGRTKRSGGYGLRAK